jgi:hypothetical protein
MTEFAEKREDRGWEASGGEAAWGPLRTVGWWRELPQKNPAFGGV